MICKRIQVTNFRNIASAEVEFHEGVNLLCGDNAQGKTNLLEAIYFTALGKSFRPAKEAELIRFGEEGARLVNEFHDSLRDQTLAVTLFGGQRRRVVEQNGVRIGKMSDVVGAFRVVLFCPEHLSIVQGGPDLRRAYLNVALSQLRPVYLHSLQRYNHILKERNSLIRHAQEDKDTFRATMPIWSAQLAREAAILAAHRDRYVREANEYVRACFADMTGGSELPELSYVNSLGLTGEALQDREAVEAKYLDLLTTRYDREIGAGTTLYGIHKDDIQIHLNGRPARLYASQGQQRSLSLAMKLAEGSISAAESGGDMPVFLFDDVLSELDIHRRTYLMHELRGRQVILTATDAEDAAIVGGVKVIRVKNGEFISGGVAP